MLQQSTPVDITIARDLQPVELVPFHASHIVYVSKDSDIPDLTTEKVVGVDIEHSKKLKYSGQICLIQLKIGPTVVVLDIIEIGVENAILINALKLLFENPDITKVFYGGQSDLLWLQRDFKISIQGYCDVKELADVCKRLTDTSLVSLWQVLCGQQFEKGQKKELQTSEWHMRALTDNQLHYAALDAYYLPYLRYVLLKELVDSNSIIELRTAQKRIQNQASKEYVKEGKSSLHFMSVFEKKNKTKYTYNGQSLLKFIYSQLCLLRQEKASYHNQSILTCDSDESLLIFLNTFQILDKVNDLESFQQFTDKKTDVTDSAYYDCLSQISDKSWEQIRAFYLNSIFERVQSSPEFVEYCISQVYRTEAFKEHQKETELKRQNIKKERFLKFQEKYTCHKTVYGQARIMSPDDVCLCVCDAKKANWYLTNNLYILISDHQAVLVSQTPLVVKLNFQPSGVSQTDEKDVEENKFYTISREVQCVVCGAKHNYMKYHIVPVIYKKFFENEFKSHRSHDVLLLCIRCHEKASASNDKLRNEIAQKYNVPVTQLNENQLLMENIKLLKRQALMYKNNSFKDKQDRKEGKLSLRQVFTDIIANEKVRNSAHLDFSKIEKKENGDYRLNEEFISLCLDIKNKEDSFRDSSKKAMKVNLHGQQVVAQLTSDKDVEDFIMLWRSHFITTMSPQFLPEGWSVDHKFKRKFGDKSIFNKQD